MPTTPGDAIRTVADIIQVVTNCSKNEADAGEREFCSKPENVAKMALACGVSTTMFGIGGKLFIGAVATEGASLLPALAIGGLGALGVKRYCTTLIKNGISIK